jgi:hypothetical protein
MSKLTGFVDDDGTFCCRIQFNTKSDSDMREVMSLKESPEAIVETYGEDCVTVIIRSLLEGGVLVEDIG